MNRRFSPEMARRRTARRLREAPERKSYSLESQEVKGWKDGQGPEDAPTVLHRAKVERAEFAQEAAVQRVQEAPTRRNARADVFALAEGEVEDSREEELLAQELLDEAFAAEKTLRTFNLQGIHNVIRENRLESNRMVRKSDESLGPEEFADRALADQIARRMEQDHSSARDAALAILGEVYVKAAVPLRQLEGMKLSHDLEQNMVELSGMVQQDSGANYDTTWDYLKRLPDTPGSIRMAA